MKDCDKWLREALASIPGLPSFAIQAIAREVESSVRQWLTVSRLMAQNPEIVPAILSGLETEEEWGFVMAFISHYGGQRVYVPKTLIPGHHFVADLGEACAAWICKRFGGEPMAVPKASELLRAARNRAIIADYRAGKKPNQIAHDHDLAYPWVLRLLACEPPLPCRKRRNRSR